ncbi:C-C motif chemokine 20 [Lepisosteus oculatus]|uniref:C-C motif chemokine 20-like n=1 Tax=Lepisosteus oculatus TaxID=7918 RepID=W5MIY6_LEPOC|nr:PREDICTED: C-C motif chemokine 20-like [Lepisosteus oculatus]
MSQRSLFTVALLSCLFLIITLEKAFAYRPLNLDCCINYTTKPVPFKLIKGYYEQSSLEVCRLDAIIFYTYRGKKICASAKDTWVKNALQYLSSRLKNMAKPTSTGEEDGKNTE